MATSTRFAVGVHLLTALAANPGKVLRSEDVADSANTNPVVVRRLFSLMTTAGLIRARLGPGGGSNWRGWRTTSLCAMSSLRWRAASSSLSIGRPQKRILFGRRPTFSLFYGTRQHLRSKLCRKSCRALRLSIPPALCLPEARTRMAQNGMALSNARS
jgi:hypothetical protein